MLFDLWLEARNKWSIQKNFYEILLSQLPKIDFVKDWACKSVTQSTTLALTFLICNVFLNGWEFGSICIVKLPLNSRQCGLNFIGTVWAKRCLWLSVSCEHEKNIHNLTCWKDVFKIRISFFSPPWYSLYVILWHDTVQDFASKIDASQRNSISKVSLPNDLLSSTVGRQEYVIHNTQ